MQASQLFTQIVIDQEFVLPPAAAVWNVRKSPLSNADSELQEATP
jgi:hypothetical protein